MKKNDHIHKELSEIAPNLANLEKENPFEVPHNYFQNMQSEVLEKIYSEQAPITPSFWQSLQQQVSRLFAPKPALVISTLGISLFLFFSNQNEIPATQLDLFEGLSTDVVTAYIEANIEEFESTDILQLAENETIDIFETSTSSEEYIDELIDGLEEEDILDIF